jgi:hypothetical protein
MTMTIFYVIFCLYSIAIIWGIIKYDGIRYRILFGYMFGLACGAGSLLVANFSTAIIIAVLLGLVANLKMMISPNR